MNNKQKAALTSYSHNAASTPGTMVELKADDIRNTLNAHAYTWVHIWVPYCKGPTCRPLPYYELIHQQHVSQDMQSFLVSHVYDVKQVPGTVPLYVIKDSAYGHKMYKSMRLFYNELITDKLISKQYPSHMVFKRDKLVYWGADISNAIVDSVMRYNK